MTQDKMRRIITACVSAATVLFVFLLSFLIYQWITIANLDKKESKLERENKKLDQIIAEGNEDLEYYLSDIGKDWLAFELGFSKGEK